MTSLQDVETVIFDLDGTLVDTAPDLSMALNHVLTGIGRSPVALENVRHMVGFGARAM
ncbi:MAG: HAD hydrolase-like protein, partial [Sphingomonadales bacterium]